MPAADMSPDGTPTGFLTPWETAKLYALHVACEAMVEHMGETPQTLFGKSIQEFISERVHVQGGGAPDRSTIFRTIAKCKDPTWFPGKQDRAQAGRPPVYSPHVKEEVARVAMALKRKNIAPTPRRVRAKLPNKMTNPETGMPMDTKTVLRIFQTLCFDDDIADPWQYLPCLSQDILPEHLKPLRVAACRHILKTTNAKSWVNHVSIDPCYTLLPKSEAKLEQLQIKAMGKYKWQSGDSRRKGNNLRVPATAGHQQGSDSIRVDWTPIFARGKLKVYVCDAELAKRDLTLPTKLTDAENLGKFIQNVLPTVLEEMRQEHGWQNIPRTIIHDKASYMVTAKHEALQLNFAAALSAGGFKSWVGGPRDSSKWLVSKLGDLYLHETVISHVRRLLDTEFPCTRLGESRNQFAQRMGRVVDFMNSEAFSENCGGKGLAGLAKDLRSRCECLIARRGERLPK